MAKCALTADTDVIGGALASLETADQLAVSLAAETTGRVREAAADASLVERVISLLLLVVLITLGKDSVDELIDSCARRLKGLLKKVVTVNDLALLGTTDTNLVARGTAITLNALAACELALKLADTRAGTVTKDAHDRTAVLGGISQRGAGKDGGKDGADGKLHVDCCNCRVIISIKKQIAASAQVRILPVYDAV